MYTYIIGYTAFISGIIIGSLLYYNAGSKLLLIYYTRRMLDREYFYDAYDAVLDPVNIDFFIAHFNLRSDKKLRKMIKKAEPKAHENFLALRKFFFRKHITRTFTFCLFLGVLFFYFYLYYLIGLLLAIFAFTGYLRFVKGYQLGFFERLAIISVLAPHK